ncbi:polyhydroxybutyrate depolymerase [uncultured Tateyamaria sp.]|uniref:alpha/beta hydrolase family esterase n=1 Tax=uncultured Tateyamaria sp. TaxID=455651 RepID=UPI002622130F|nr:polyhydroxybutyrate depolymerase [uncultured Tateyamaria sp.]
MRLFALPLIAALSLFAAPVAAQSLNCGDADTPCTVQSGNYHMAVPDGVAPKGLVIHLHGAGAKASGLLNSGLARGALARGYAFVAPEGYHPESRFIRNWSVRARGSSFERDDAVFLREVLADVQGKTGLAGEPVLLAGFSRGGSMVWDIACHDPSFATAYAPLAGAFWDDLPETCAAPVMLYHTHGWNDRTVPLEGRSFGGGRVVQGDVWASLKILRETNGCDARQPERNSYDGELWFRHWTDCQSGKIELMLHKGGHGAPSGWAGRMLDWFEAQLS